MAEGVRGFVGTLVRGVSLTKTPVWQAGRMRLDDFITALPKLWPGQEGATADLPDERIHAEMLRATSGMASENKLAVLNLAAKHLDAGEIYLEAGAWRGTSICAAALGNPDRRFVSVDNFSQFGGPRQECEANIEQWADGNVELHDSDFWSFLKQRPLHAPVGVYFYDAGHEFWDQWRALDVIEPFLADEALIMVDDASWKFVAAADAAFVESHPRFEFLRRFPMDSPNGLRWWNGLDLISYRRALPEADPAQVRDSHRAALLRYGLAYRGFDLTRALVRDKIGSRAKAAARSVLH